MAATNFDTVVANGFTGNLTGNSTGVHTQTPGVIVGSRFHVTFPQVAAADVAKTFFIAPVACKIISARETHVTVAGQAGTLNVEKLTAGQAPSGGAVTLTTGWDLTSTANTSVSIATLGTAAATLAAGDSLCLKVTAGAATSYALGTITILMEYV